MTPRDASGLAASRRSSRPERRAQLVELAGELAGAEGVGAITMERLAAAADVNKTIVYRVFANRSEVLAALFEREAGALATAIGEAGAGATDARSWLRVAVGVWFDAIAENGGLLAVLLDGGSSDAELLERRVAWERRAVRTWGEGIAAFTGADVDVAHDTAAIVLAGLRGAQSRWLDDGRPRAEIEDRLVRVATLALEDLR